MIPAMSSPNPSGLCFPSSISSTGISLRSNARATRKVFKCSLSHAFASSVMVSIFQDPTSSARIQKVCQHCQSSENKFINKSLLYVVYSDIVFLVRPIPIHELAAVCGTSPEVIEVFLRTHADGFYIAWGSEKLSFVVCSESSESCLGHVMRYTSGPSHDNFLILLGFVCGIKQGARV